MCKQRLINLYKKNRISMQTILTSIPLAALVDRECILCVVACLVKEGLIEQIELNTYVTNIWITSDEKVLIENEIDSL